MITEDKVYVHTIWNTFLWNKIRNKMINIIPHSIRTRKTSWHTTNTQTIILFYQSTYSLCATHNALSNYTLQSIRNLKNP